MACAELGQLKDARRAAGLFSSVVLVKGVCVHVLFGVEQAGEACRAAGQFSRATEQQGAVRAAAGLDGCAGRTEAACKCIGWILLWGRCGCALHACTFM